MSVGGIAVYNASTNELKVFRASDSSNRRIKCSNLNPNRDYVKGIQIEGDEIWVLTNTNKNNRPNRKFIYKFSSLSVVLVQDIAK